MTALTLTTRASLRPARYDDMFASDDDYRTKAREIFPNRIDGRQVPRKWSRTDKPLGEAPRKSVVAVSAAMGEENRRAVLGALDQPRAPFQVAAIIGLKRATVSGIMRELAKSGRIKEAGETRTDKNKPVMCWVRT